MVSVTLVSCPLIVSGLLVLLVGDLVEGLARIPSGRCADVGHRCPLSLSSVVAADILDGCSGGLEHLPAASLLCHLSDEVCDLPSHPLGDLSLVTDAVESEVGEVVALPFAGVDTDAVGLVRIAAHLVSVFAVEDDDPSRRLRTLDVFDRDGLGLAHDSAGLSGRQWGQSA